MIKTVWLDNPPVNAVDRGIIDTLWSELEQLDDEVRVVVLRGQGERAFSAGADISGFVGAGDASGRPAGIQPVADLIERHRCRSWQRSTATASAAASRSRSPATSASPSATRSSASPR